MLSVKVYTGESRPYSNVLLFFLLFLSHEVSPWNRILWNCFLSIRARGLQSIHHTLCKAATATLFTFFTPHYTSTKSTLLSNQTPFPFEMDGITSLLPAFLLITEQCHIQLEASLLLDDWGCFLQQQEMSTCLALYVRRDMGPAILRVVTSYPKCLESTPSLSGPG